MDVLHLFDTETAFRLNVIYRHQDEANKTTREAIDIIKNLFQNNNDSDVITETIIHDLKGQLQFALGMEKTLEMTYEGVLKEW